MSTPKLSIDDTVQLPALDVHMPRLGFGTFQMQGQECVNACLAALEVGYRHIDTAQMYANEAEVGEALRQSKLDRSEVFVTTKIASAALKADKTYKRVSKSVETIGGKDGYIDLFLVHNPSGGIDARKAKWEAIQQLYQEGKARAIGVSNYQIQHLDELKTYAKIWPPHVNQIALNPWFQQRELVEYCNANGIIIQAHSPLTQGSKLEDPVIQKLAEKYGKSPGQLLIRYALQKGWVPLAKSARLERIMENADVFDKLEIAKEDMKMLDELDGLKSSSAKW